MLGNGVLINKELFVVLRALTIGGSAAINFATAFYPPDVMFEKYGIDLSEALKTIKKSVPIDILDDSLVWPHAANIEKAAIGLSLPWQRLPKYKCRTECHRCLYGCPCNAKWHPGMLLQDGVSTAVEFICNARVTKVLIKNRVASGVEYIHHGNIVHAYTKHIVVAVGGLGTPMILREAGISGVGEPLFVDPVIATTGIIAGAAGSGNEIPMVSGMINHSAGYALSDMALPAPLHYLFSGNGRQICPA